MSAIATVLAAMGHQVSGSDLKESAGLERLRPQGVEVCIGHDADNLRADLDYVDDLDRDTRHAISRWSRPANAASRSCGGPTCSAAIAATRRTVAVAGTHGKTTTSSMLALVLTQAGLRPVVHHRRRRERDRQRGDLGRRRVVRGRGRRERRHLRRASARRVVVTNVEARPPGVPRFVRSVARGVRSLLVGASRARSSCAPTTRSRPSWARHTEPHTYGTATSAEFRMDDLALGRWGASFQLVRERRRPSASSSSRWPGCTTRATRARQWPWVCCSARRSRPRARGARQVRRRRPAVRASRRGRRHHVRRRLRPLADRGRRGAGRSALGRVASRRVRLPAASLQPHRVAVAGLRRRVRRRRRVGHHRRLRSRRGAPAWRLRQAGRADGARRAPVGTGRLPATPLRHRGVPARPSCDRATCA